MCVQVRSRAHVHTCRAEVSVGWLLILSTLHFVFEAGFCTGRQFTILAILLTRSPWSLHVSVPLGLTGLRMCAVMLSFPVMLGLRTQGHIVHGAQVLLVLYHTFLYLQPAVPTCTCEPAPQRKPTGARGQEDRDKTYSHLWRARPALW